MKYGYRNEIFYKREIVLFLLLIVLLIFSMLSHFLNGGDLSDIPAVPCIMILIILSYDIIKIYNRKRHKEIVNKGICYRGKVISYKTKRNYAKHFIFTYYILKIKYYDVQVNSFKIIETPQIYFEEKPYPLNKECNVYIWNNSTYVTDFVSESKQTNSYIFDKFEDYDTDDDIIKKYHLNSKSDNINEFVKSLKDLERDKDYYNSVDYNNKQDSMHSKYALIFLIFIIIFGIIELIDIFVFNH